MSSTGNLSIGGGDAIGSESSHTAPAYEPKRPKRAAPDPAPRANSGHRLVIQQDRETGEWIYTVTDRDTGEIIAHASREEVAKLGLKANYAAGALIKAKA
jgi:hypothetical protein